MNILLLNTNPVVSRLVALCMRDDEISFEEVTDVSLVQRDRYDVVFVDDASYVPEAQIFVEDLMVKRRVYLCGKHVSDESFEGFDTVIHKPFLPSQITAAIEDVKEMDASLALEAEEEAEADASFIFPLSTEVEQSEAILPLVAEKEEEETMQEEDDVQMPEEEKETEPSSAPEVLDSHEIERIKALLEEDEETVQEIEDPEIDYETRKVEVITEHLEADGLEIVLEDDIADILSQKTEASPKKEKASKKKKQKKKSTKKAKKEKEESYTFEEALIAAIEGMKPKKIKKLLKDADVTIQIKFKDKR